MNALSFTVPGTPVAKGRARSFIRAGHVAHFTPEKTARYENLVKLAGREAMAGSSPMQGALSLVCTFWMPVPASYSKKRTADYLAAREYPAKKPDTDNILKAIKDGCNAVVWGAQSFTGNWLNYGTQKIMASFTDTQLSICRMLYEHGKTKLFTRVKVGLSGKELACEINAIKRKTGVTSEKAIGAQLVKAGIL